MYTPASLPCPDSVQLERIAIGIDRITLHLVAIRPSVPCPACAHDTSHIHSHYIRKLADLPWQDLTVEIRLYSRRFFCRNPLCTTSIFTEPFPRLVHRYARRTLRLQHALHLICLMLGGEAGARLAGELQLTVSPDTILRAVAATGEQPFETPRVLGVDDFAFRRGMRYGTILVDLEKHRVVDLLPDREAATLADWLRHHPGVAIISRDRSPTYAQGAREGAPQAIQVADRWHLLKNLTDVMERLLLREHTAIRQATRLMIHLEADALPSPVVSTPCSPRLQEEKRQRRVRRMARYQEVQALKEQGLTARYIARTMRLSRQTVQLFLHSHEYPEMRTRQPRRSKLDPFLDCLRRRYEDGCRNARTLYREIQAQGYDGSHTLIKDKLREWRKVTGATAEQPSVRGSPAMPKTSNTSFKIPSSRSVLWWLLKPDGALPEEALRFVRQLCSVNSTIRLAREMSLWFLRMVRERRSEEFGEWIAAVREFRVPMLKNFAEKLLQDRPAVLAAMTLEWSNGQTEGQVNRLKLLKRQMYGQAGFDLLRARVVAAK